MKPTKLLILFTTIFSLIVVSGCKKDDDPEPDNTAPQYEPKTVAIPDAMSQSQDPGAQMTVSYINMVNGMSGYSGMLVPPGKVTLATTFKDGGTETYTWEINDESGVYTVTLSVTETATMYKWEMTINGTVDGQTFVNFTYIKAEEAKDGSSSTFTLYDWDTQGIFMTLSWYENTDGSFQFTFEVPEDIIISMIAYPDGSGSIEIKEWEIGEYLLQFRAEWNSTGHGEWWEYYSGVLSDHGIW